MRVRAAATCAALLLLAACNGEASAPPATGTPTTPASSSPTPTLPASPTTSTTTEPTSATRAWHLGLAPLTQPVAVDGVAVVLARGRQGGLRVVAVDPDTGHLLWTRPASTSAVSVEEPLAVEAVGTEVAYFRPAGPRGAARLVLADAHTGHDLVSSPVEVFTTPIAPCDSPVTRLCGTARPYSDVALMRYSLVVATGRFGPAPGPQPPLGSRPVGPGGLIDLGDRAPERVGVFVNGQLLWSMPVVAYFPDGTTTDAGWKFTLVDDRYVGTLDQPFPVNGELDMAGVATASFEAATGRIDWSVPGTSLDCRGMAEFVPGVHARCHYSGDALFTHGRPRFTDVQVSLEGFEAGSGKRTWQYDLGANAPLLRGQRIPALIGSAGLLVGRPGNQVVLDLDTGEQTVPSPGAVYLCPSTTRVATERGDLQGDMLLTPCTATRAPTTGIPPVATLESLHQTFGDVVVVSTGTGLTGYRLR